MAKNKAYQPVEADYPPAASDQTMPSVFSNKAMDAGIAAGDLSPSPVPVSSDETPPARKRSAQWLATARGGLADQLRIVADQMIQFAANPVINTLTEDGINAVTEAMDALCLLKEEIEAAN